MIKRKRPRKHQTAADKLEAARVAAFDADISGAEQITHDAAVEQFGRALKASMDGIMRSGGKQQSNTKTLRTRGKYVGLISECGRHNVPLGPPHTKSRMDAVMAIAAKIAPNLTREQVLKHLQRHRV